MIEEPLTRLIAALREELKHYGEMLALLEQQQELVVKRASDELFRSTTLVQTQVTRLQEARRHRDECRREVARALGLAGEVELKVLVRRLPADYQPLINALVAENNQLLRRVQACAHQNHLLLSRSLELMQQFLRTLFPMGDTPVYNGNGHRLNGSISGPTLLEMIG